MPQPKDKDWLNGLKNPYICCLKQTHLKPRDTCRLKVRGWKKIFYANGDQKKAGVRIPISDKIDFEIKPVIRDKDQSINPRRKYSNYKYICIQHRSTKYIKQISTNMKGGINNNTIIEGDFNTAQSPMDRSTK